MGRKAKKRKSGRRIVVFLLLITIIAVSVYKNPQVLGNQSMHSLLNKAFGDRITAFGDKVRAFGGGTSQASIGKPQVPILKAEEEPEDAAVSISPSELSSSNGILIRLKDHAILLDKHSAEKIYPASLTKMMTAIVAIEHLTDLEVEIPLTNSTFKGLYEANASMTGFQPDEEIRAIDLLCGVLLASGAESCIGLADHIAGSEIKFVKLMNQKASELGMDNTHFGNVTGLHDNNHYTTVRDQALLLSYALENKTFRKVFTMSRHSTPPTNKHLSGITIHSTMFKKLKDPKIAGEILGGKTGYTDEAGLCLASLAKVARQEYILITAGAEGNLYTEQYNINDALAVYSSIRE